MNILTTEEIKDVEALVKVMPVVDVTVKAETKGKEIITTDDIVSMEFKIRYPLLKEDQYPGFVHSKSFPFLKKQTWWVVISDNQSGRIMITQPIVFR